LTPEEILAKALFIIDKGGEIVNYFLKPPVAEQNKEEFMNEIMNMSSNKV